MIRQNRLRCLVMLVAISGCTPASPEITAPTASPSASALANWSVNDRAAAVIAAENAMIAFARPDLPADKWRNELGKWVTNDAAKYYAHVDPTTIAAHEVIGHGVIVDDESLYVAVVEVLTNAGWYRIVVSREETDRPWLAERLTLVR